MLVAQSQHHKVPHIRHTTLSTLNIRHQATSAVWWLTTELDWFEAVLEYWPPVVDVGLVMPAAWELDPRPNNLLSYGVRTTINSSIRSCTFNGLFIKHTRCLYNAFMYQSWFLKPFWFNVMAVLHQVLYVNLGSKFPTQGGEKVPIQSWPQSFDNRYWVKLHSNPPANTSFCRLKAV